MTTTHHNCQTCGRIQLDEPPAYPKHGTISQRLRAMSELYDPKHTEGHCTWCTDLGAARLMREAAAALEEPYAEELRTALTDAADFIDDLPTMNRRIDARVDGYRALIAKTRSPEIVRPQAGPFTRHDAECFNDTPGAVLCQVCGGDLPTPVLAVGHFKCERCNRTEPPEQCDKPGCVLYANPVLKPVSKTRNAMTYLEQKNLAVTIREKLANATEGAWQWGTAGSYNFVAFDGADIVALAQFRAKSDADLVSVLQQNAGAIADCLDSLSEGSSFTEDAARWRWWRKWWLDDRDDCEHINRLEYDVDDPAAFDAAVDAAIAAEGAPK